VSRVQVNIKHTCTVVMIVLVPVFFGGASEGVMRQKKGGGSLFEWTEESERCIRKILFR
jgi:hypothetical protein